MMPLDDLIVSSFQGTQSKSINTAGSGRLRQRKRESKERERGRGRMIALPFDWPGNVFISKLTSEHPPADEFIFTLYCATNEQRRRGKGQRKGKGRFVCSVLVV